MPHIEILLKELDKYIVPLDDFDHCMIDCTIKREDVDGFLNLYLKVHLDATKYTGEYRPIQTIGAGYKSDLSITKKNEKNSVDKSEINKKMQSNYQIYNSKNNLYIKDEHRIKNKNEIKKLIRLYNKEKDIKRNKSGVNKNNIIYKNNKITNNKISNFFFDYKSNIINNNVKNTNINNKFLKYSYD